MPFLHSANPKIKEEPNPSLEFRTVMNVLQDHFSPRILLQSHLNQTRNITEFQNPFENPWKISLQVEPKTTDDSAHILVHGKKYQAKNFKTE